LVACHCTFFKVVLAAPVKLKTKGSSFNPVYTLSKFTYIYTKTLTRSTNISSLPALLAPTTVFSPVTIDNVKSQIGLVQNFFLAKLHANNDQPLIEDDDLPQKQRFPKPRLPPTGKITSPRKRPIKEPGPGKGHPRKKLKLNDGEAKATDADTGNEEAKKKDEGEKENANEKPLEKEKAPEKDKAKMKLPAKKDAEVLTNGIHPSPAPAPDLNGMPTSNGKAKELNPDSGGMISPESLEAT